MPVESYKWSHFFQNVFTLVYIIPVGWAGLLHESYAPPLSVLSVLLTGAQAPPILAGLGTQSLCGGVVADWCLMVAMVTARFGPVSFLVVL